MNTFTALLIVTFASSAIIFCERGFPFFLFAKKNPPKILSFVEKYILFMIMAALTLYCLKDINFIQNTNQIDFKGFIPYIAGLSITIILHLWKRNSLLSIFSGTAVFMILIRVL